jgi:hypothetical protein
MALWTTHWISLEARARLGFAAYALKTGNYFLTITAKHSAMPGGPASAPQLAATCSAG